MKDLIIAFQKYPVGTAWRILMLPITAPLMGAAWVLLGMSQFIAHGKWKTWSDV